MCGLVGVWHPDGAAAENVVATMLETIRHRGPDGSGFWSDSTVSFGHCRLSIIDTSGRAHQPMPSPDGTKALAYNGEVYNYRELRDELIAEGITFDSSGDTEVVLKALDHWGPETAIPRFNGMFAFAYYDRKAGALWLARDRAGIKPLLVMRVGDTVVFASELKALLAHPGASPKLDPAAFVRWLQRPRQPAHRMLMRDIAGPGAGWWWRIDRSGIDRVRYYQAADTVDLARLSAGRRASARSLVDEAEKLLKRSVELHLASDAPLATMCSGGVDSSLITAYAKELTGNNVTAYVADILFRDGEGEQAEKVGRHLGVPVTRVVVDRDRYLRLWPLAIWHTDAPILHRSDPALLAVAQTCHADGIKVLLTGEGSDELFAGYSTSRDAFKVWRKLESPFRYRFRRRRRAAILARLSGEPLQGTVARDLRSAVVLGHDHELELLPLELIRKFSQIPSIADRALLADALFAFSDNLSLLLHRHDRMGMAASMEMRVPFLENQLIDFAFHLPSRVKVRRNTGKWIIKQAAARYLPKDVVFAKKKGFPAPADFMRGTEMLLHGGHLAEVMGWTATATDAIIRNLAAEPGLSFHLVGAELWLRMTLDGALPEDLGERLIECAAPAR